MSAETPAPNRETPVSVNAPADIPGGKRPIKPIELLLAALGEATAEGWTGALVLGVRNDGGPRSKVSIVATPEIGFLAETLGDLLEDEDSGRLTARSATIDVAEVERMQRELAALGGDR